MSTFDSAVKTLSKKLGNAAYHAALIGGLVIIYRKVGHMIMKNSLAPQLDKLNSGSSAAVLYIGAALLTKDYLVSSATIPDDIMK